MVDRLRFRQGGVVGIEAVDRWREIDVVPPGLGKGALGEYRRDFPDAVRQGFRARQAFEIEHTRGREILLTAGDEGSPGLGVGPIDGKTIQVERGVHI